MRTLLPIAILILIQACSSTTDAEKMRDDIVRSLPRENTQGRPTVDLMRCQLDAFNQAQEHLATLSVFNVSRQPEVNALVASLKKKTLHCYRVPSEAEETINKFISKTTYGEEE